jgi:hypothetical protein
MNYEDKTLSSILNLLSILLSLFIFILLLLNKSVLLFLSVKKEAQSEFIFCKYHLLNPNLQTDQEKWRRHL